MPRILLISSDKRALRTWRRWLADASKPAFEVATATSDEDALAQYEAQPPDAILLDASLPGEGAREVVRMVREDPAAPPIALLAGPERADWGAFIRRRGFRLD